MNYDRAVRLKALWNGSLGFNLSIDMWQEGVFILRQAKRETSSESLARMRRLAEQLGLQLTTGYTDYTFC